MTVDYICKTVAELVKKHGESEPARLAVEMGIILRYEPMGTSENACKGFFLYQSRKRLITVNSDLDNDRRRIVLAHELGHAALHREQARISAMHDFSMYDSSSTLEYEANLFAAELLLKDSETLNCLRETDSFFSAAKNLSVPAELLDFKLRILRHKGYELYPPLRARSDFLKGKI